MQFSTSAVTAALLGLASAQKVHVVSVSNSNKALIFSPDNIKAATGDMIQFQFLAGNHSVVQSNFDNPCSPIQEHDTTQTGLFSGYMDVAAGLATGMIPVYTMEVKTEKPLWVYCSQGKHCQAGMVMVVNENTAANATRSLAEFKKLAGQAPDNIDPTEIPGAGSGSDDTTGGTTSTIPSPTGGSGTPDSTGSPSATATPEQALGSMVSTSAWMGLLSVAAVLAMF